MSLSVTGTLSHLTGARPRELSRIVPLAGAYGLIMASLYVLKPARNALFLDKLGIGQLPYVLILVAIIGGGAAFVFTRLTRHLRLDRLILSSFIALSACLVAFWLVLPYGLSWTFYLFYVFVNLYGLMGTALLWLLANAVFNAREGRRLFGLIGTVGIVGAIVGAGFTAWAATAVGTENLLIVCAGMAAACSLMLYPLHGREVAEQEADDGEGVGILTSLKETDLLQLLGGMAALAAVVAVVIDVQFNQIVDEVYPDKDAKAAFFGEFFACLSVLALAFQVLATPRVLRSLGVVPALFFLPASMALGSLAVLVVPGLAAGVLVKLGDGGFRHSIHKAATELLYLPIPRQAKKRTKVFLDATVDNLATGLGAVLVLVAVGAGVSYSHLAFLSLALVGLWLLLIGRSRHAYIDAFRRAIEGRQIDLADYTFDITEAATLDSLMAAMSSGNERHSIYALDMLAQVHSPDVVGPVSALLSHASAEVRYKALRVLRNQSANLPLAQIEALQSDGDLQVRIEALLSLCLHGGGDRIERLKRALSSSDAGVRTAAVGCIAEHGTDAEQDLVDEPFIRQLWTQTADDLEGRVQAARIVGNLYERARRPYLREIVRRLMDETETPVVRQTIQSLGQLRDPDHIPWLLRRLDSRHYRRDARRALASYGREVLPALCARLRDVEAGFLSRNRAVRVMADISHQECVDALLDSLDGVEPLLQYAVIKSLSKLRKNSADLRFEPSRVAASLQQAAQSYFGLFQILQLYEEGEELADNRGMRLLLTAVRERQELNLERIFRSLGLGHSPSDMYSAYLGYVGGDRSTRASALEFLDNVLHREEKELLVPFLDSATPTAAIEHGKRLFGGGVDSWPEAIGFLMQSGDAWLRACALYSLTGAMAGEFGEQVSLLRRDPDPVVRETADLVLRRA